MTYIDLAETHRKLADTYVYLDKMIEFKDHYHQKSIDLESENRQLKEDLVEANKALGLMHGDISGLNEMLDEKQTLISELWESDKKYEELILGFDGKISTMIHIITWEIDARQEAGDGEDTSELKSMCTLLRIVDKKLQEIKDNYAEEEEREGE